MDTESEGPVSSKDKEKQTMDTDSEANTAQNDDSNLNGKQEFELHLIHLYKECPELWDPKLVTYTNKCKRNAALTKIATSLQKYDKDFTVEKLKRKINILRSNFNKVHNKLLRSLESGWPYDIYRPRLWYYHELYFITGTDYPVPIEYLKPRKSQHNPSVPENVKNDNVASLATTCYDVPDSDSDIIAKSWAIKLNRLSGDQRCFAEKIINDILFEGEMGTLTRDGLLFLRNSTNKNTEPETHLPNLYLSPTSCDSFEYNVSPFAQSCPSSNESVTSEPST